MQIVERFVLAKLRNRTFFSLAELNAAIRDCVAAINAKIMRRVGKRRAELLEVLERPALKALPNEPYPYAEWKRARVAPDYHIEIADHFYSVPSLGLAGMAKALEEQRHQPDVAALSFEERLGRLVDREAIDRENKRLVSRLKFAGLPQNAIVEDVDMKAARGLDKAMFAKLVAGNWIAQRQNLIIVGKTGLGKSWLACTLAHKACRDDRSVLYHRVPRLFDALALARGDGRHARLLKSIARSELLILDDWGLANVTADQGRDMLEILDGRQGRGSTIVTSQVDVKHWHEMFANPTVADTILDRLVHNPHRLNLAGESLRKGAAKRTGLDGKQQASDRHTIDGSRCPRLSERCPRSIGITVRLQS